MASQSTIDRENGVTSVTTVVDGPVTGSSTDVMPDPDDDFVTEPNMTPYTQLGYDIMNFKVAKLGRPVDPDYEISPSITVRHGKDNYIFEANQTDSYQKVCGYLKDIYGLEGKLVLWHNGNRLDETKTMEENGVVLVVRTTENNDDNIYVKSTDLLLSIDSEELPTVEEYTMGNITEQDNAPLRELRKAEKEAEEAAKKQKEEDDKW